MIMSIGLYRIIQFSRFAFESLLKHFLSWFKSLDMKTFIKAYPIYFTVPFLLILTELDSIVSFKCPEPFLENEVQFLRPVI